MTQALNTLRNTPFGLLSAQRLLSLWILPGSSQDDLEKLAKIGWNNVWNFAADVDFNDLYVNSGALRHPILVSSLDRDVSEFSRNKFIRIYQPKLRSSGGRQDPLLAFSIMQLKSSVATVSGGLVVAGPIDQNIDEIRLILGFSPHAVFLASNGNSDFSEIEDLPVFRWTETIESLVKELERSTTADQVPSVDLKGAQGLLLDEALLETVDKNWIFLSSEKTRPIDITQEAFDLFLQGETEWGVYLAGAAFPRRLDLESDWDGRPEASAQSGTLSEYVLRAISQLERSEPDPRDPLRQIRIFAEIGSGTTTALRDAAITVSQKGYPVLVSKPHPVSLVPQSVTLFIIDTQDRWRTHREGPGSGSGNLPFVIFIDKDSDEDRETHRLARAVSAIGREVVIVRAFERARDEIDRAKNVLKLRADVSEAEMVAIGRHLRQFAIRHGLAEMPSTQEWRAFHAGLTYAHRFIPGAGTDIDEIPYLFLIGIHPFISERVSGLQGLEQYYFQKWDNISKISLRSLIEIMAAAGVYNLSVPYDVVRRVQILELAELEQNYVKEGRLLDLFLDWYHTGLSTQNWYLRIRHPVIGRLLSRAIDPIEGDVPYRPLLAVLDGLSTKSEDVWFAESLVVRAGRSFKRFAPSFSLESDTPLQRAAGAIFQHIPEVVKDTSRVIRHHEARYHMHIIHACITALEKPHTTTLSQGNVLSILEDEYQVARVLLQRALETSSKIEPEKYVYNTFALLLFDYADAARKLPDVSKEEFFTDRFAEAIDVQERAIADDPTDGLSRYQFINRIFQSTPNSQLSDDDKLSLYSRAELRFQELLRLHQERRVRNIDPVDVEIQLSIAYDAYHAAMEQIPSSAEAIDRFIAKDPEAGIRLAIRGILGRSSIKEGFKDAKVAGDLREFRSDLLEIPGKTARGLLYLYRLFTEDSEGRLEFATRTKILHELKQQSFEQYLPHWHDEAALLCQLDNLGAGAAQFRELRAFRRTQNSLWFWVEERALLSQKRPTDLREMTFVVRDPDAGWAEFHNTGIRIKYQPYQFPLLKRESAFSGFVRFTLDGMQVVTRKLAEADLAAMGLR